jgi:hypothetical protein
MTKNKKYSFEEIIQICVEKRLSGMMPAQIFKDLIEMGIEGWSRERIKGVTKRKKIDKIRAERNISESQIKEKEGATERKPKYELKDGYYLIRYGKNKTLRIHEKDADKALKLYTLGNMTMNQVALELGLSRQEFYALKTAFSIVKNDLPILPERLDELTPDEISEELRIEKKRLAVKKFEQGKIKDIEATNKKYRELEYWLKLVSDRINKIEPDVYAPQATARHDGIERIATICDIHAGTRIDSKWGKFSFEIMRNRFKEFTSQILQKTEPCELTIFSGGDALAGNIKMSIVKMGDNFIDSICEVTECFISMIGSLILNGYKIKLCYIMGNHGAADSDKTARTLADNYERLIFWAIKMKLADVKNFEIIEPHFNMGLIKIHDYSVICVHGDNGSTKQLADLERLFRRENVVEILAAHLHHQKSEEFCGVTVYHQPSFVGAEHYGISKGLVSQPGCRLIEYDKQGRRCEHYIRFSE